MSRVPCPQCGKKIDPSGCPAGGLLSCNDCGLVFPVPGASQANPFLDLDEPPSRPPVRQSRRADPRDARTIGPGWLLGMAGGAALFMGSFVPIIGAMMFTANAWQIEPAAAVALCFLGLLAILFAAGGKNGLQIFTGFASLVATAVLYLVVQSRIDQARVAIIAGDRGAGDPFRGLAVDMLQKAGYQWGWAVLLLGGIALLVSAGYKR